MKVCVAASAGGHLSEVLKVAKSWLPYKATYITTTCVVRDTLARTGTVYVVGECNYQHLVRLVKVFLGCTRVMLKERPDVVISTGAAVGCIVCFLGKLLGAKLIWVDSIANVERLSLSGRLVRLIADVFLVQWPELAQKYRGVEYVGEVV